MSRLLRIGVFAIVALAITLAAFLAARSLDPAKAAISSTSPSDGARLAQAPAAVELSSTAPLVLSQSHVTVWDRSGADLNVGQSILIMPDRLHQPVNISTAGDVTVTYHLTFVDGAELAGTLRFTVVTGRAAGTGAPMAPSAATASTNDAISGSTHQHGIDPTSAAMLVLDGVVALAAIALLLRRPRPQGYGSSQGNRRDDITHSNE